MMSNIVLLNTVIGPGYSQFVVELDLRVTIPVTPAMVRGCAPKIENTKAAMKEDNRTSVTPYC